MFTKPGTVRTSGGRAALLAAVATCTILLPAAPFRASPLALAHGPAPDDHSHSADASTFLRADERALSFSPLDLVLAADASARHGDELDERIGAVQDAMRANGPTPTGLEKLGWSFVEKARVSGNHDYYLLAGQSAQAIRALDSESPAADLLEGHALHSLHRFDEAETIARRLVARRGSPLDHALLGDTLLDQGRIAEAVASYEEMMQRRPDSRAYSRVAEVRLLTGDVEGALEAIRVASRAVSIRDREAFAWLWSRLAMIELQSGNIGEAGTASEVATSVAPGLAVAELARGRVLLATGDAYGAVSALERAVATSPLPDSMRALADAYAAAGRGDDAERILAELLGGGAAVDPRGFSLWLAETGRDGARALWLATTELGKRHDVYTLDALAMANASAGNLADAQRFMREALAAGTADPRLWYHAGVIASAGDDPAAARDWFLKARRAEQMLLPSLRRELATRLDAAANAAEAGAAAPGS